MSTLSVYINEEETPFYIFNKPKDIAAQLQNIGVGFEQFEVHVKDINGRLSNIDDPEKFFKKAYANELFQISGQYELPNINLAHVASPNPELRAQYLTKHTHESTELRFFVRGYGTFYFYDDYVLYEFTCEAGDLISIPKLLEHWFDMGDYPDFSCFRFTE